MSKFIDFYKDNYESKVFYKKATNSKYDFGLLYLYAYEYEIQYFKDTFGAYFPYYIKNEDQLDFLNPDEIDFEQKLRNISIRNWRRLSFVPKRSTASSGIYGELFLDFYLRVVSGLDPLISFASKRSFLSNRESTGIDNVVFDAKDNIEIYLTEAKFVFNKNAAKSGLMKDIKGVSDSKSHLSKEYINSYMDFVIIKASESNQIKNEKIKEFVDEVNLKFDEGIDFLQVCIDKKVKINVVLFAIFNEVDKEVNNFDSMYEDLSEELDCKLNVLGLDAYGYEIVFIPTTNSSLRIKEGIDEFYE